MKTLTSHLKTVTIVWLALFLYACQNEIVSPVKEMSNQDIAFKKPTNPQEPQLLYDGLLSTDINGGATHNGLPVNYLNVGPDCPGTAEGNNFGIMWRPLTCFEILVDYGTGPQPHTVSKSPFIPVKMKKGVIEEMNFSIQDLELNRLYATNPFPTYGVPIQGEAFSVDVLDSSLLPLYVYSNPKGGKKTDIVAYIRLDQVNYFPRLPE